MSARRHLPPHLVFSTTRLMLGGAVVIVLLVLNGVVFYSNTQTLVNHERQVAHTHVVLAALSATSAHITDAQSAQRSYIITGQRADLQAYTAALRAIDSDTTRLQRLTSDNPVQQRRIPQLHSRVGTMLAEFRTAIVLRQGGHARQARESVLSGKDAASMDSVLALLTTMERTELTLLDQRTAAATQATTATTLTLVMATGTGVVLLTGVLLLIRRAIMRRDEFAAAQQRLLVQEQSARAAAEQAIQARDAFLPLAAHELKTPLTVLFGNTQLLERRWARRGGADPRDQQSVRVIREGAGRLHQLIDQLLDVSRLQSGQLALDLGTVDLSALVCRVVEQVQLSTADHTLLVSGENEPLEVIGDALRLEQVFHNLLSNAIKYSPAGGHIYVHALRREDRAHIVVADDGIGIPEAALPHLFERFYRAPNANRQAIGGLGMGLYVVHEVVTRHGGRVEVSSDEGRGSAFIVELPLAAPVTHDHAASTPCAQLN